MPCIILFFIIFSIQKMHIMDKSGGPNKIHIAIHIAISIMNNTTHSTHITHTVIVHY